MILISVDPLHLTRPEPVFTDFGRVDCERSSIVYARRVDIQTYAAKGRLVSEILKIY